MKQNEEGSRRRPPPPLLFFPTTVKPSNHREAAGSTTMPSVVFPSGELPSPTTVDFLLCCSHRVTTFTVLQRSPTNVPYPSLSFPFVLTSIALSSPIAFVTCENVLVKDLSLHCRRRHHDTPCGGPPSVDSAFTPLSLFSPEISFHQPFRSLLFPSRETLLPPCLQPNRHHRRRRPRNGRSTLFPPAISVTLPSHSHIPSISPSSFLLSFSVRTPRPPFTAKFPLPLPQISLTSSLSPFWLERRREKRMKKKKKTRVGE